ncbi:uncharacterized protein LOC129363514 [Poeciliopsis prolifica]|uniref:uncharacterized protein LOC129363514 n=1 Tax=Poeciliopsis prolifica TaxID=188132 RepID=UPI002413706B|nr:uncharacterized protein LOC129363514 [Poeciliopsis prolifica]
MFQTDNRNRRCSGWSPEPDRGKQKAVEKVSPDTTETEETFCCKSKKTTKKPVNNQLDSESAGCWGEGSAAALLCAPRMQQRRVSVRVGRSSMKNPLDQVPLSPPNVTFQRRRSRNGPFRRNLRRHSGRSEVAAVFRFISSSKAIEFPPQQADRQLQWDLRFPNLQQTSPYPPRDYTAQLPGQPREQRCSALPEEWKWEWK